MDNDKYCIICMKKNKLINHKSHCGTFPIHRKCLSQWILKSNNQCIICRADMNFTQELTDYQFDINGIVIIVPIKNFFDLRVTLTIFILLMIYHLIYSNQVENINETSLIYHI